MISVDTSAVAATAWNEYFPIDDNTEPEAKVMDFNFSNIFESLVFPTQPLFINYNTFLHFVTTKFNHDGVNLL